LQENRDYGIIKDFSFQEKYLTLERIYLNKELSMNHEVLDGLLPMPQYVTCTTNLNLIFGTCDKTVTIRVAKSSVCFF
jgi:hypothetical protein